MKENFIITGIYRAAMVGKNEYSEEKTSFKGDLKYNELIFHFSGHSTVLFNGLELHTKPNTVRFLPKCEIERYDVIRHEHGECILICFLADRAISDHAFVIDVNNDEKIGALFKKHIDSFTKSKAINLALLFVSLIVYFGSKIAFSKIETIAFWQILNQVSILLVLYFMLAVFAGFEEKLKKVPKWINRPIEFVANVTLHIYLVQFVIIHAFENLVFPINFAVTTVTIIVAASVLFFAEHYVRKGIQLIVKKAKRENNYAENND
jgi:hypothetical protein